MLKDILDRFNCDKSAHCYYKLYEKDFKDIRLKNLNILEVGIWKGRSHLSWLKYFPNSSIYGIDIFTRIAPKEVPVLSHDRMHWIKQDSRSISLFADIQKKWGDIKFDVIIDDGLHTPIANMYTFLNLHVFLKGVYYIEDAWPLHLMSPEELEHPWIKKKAKDYTQAHMYEFLDLIRQFKVTEFDLRKDSGLPDSYIFKVEK